MAAPFPSSSRMDAWPQRRGLQTMNLRSVFTAEQQRILERYYDNGMTNQSKACFQLILQCAQEAKLDFSVVRTWVGNKRRKLASKVDQNGGMSHSLSSHGLAAGLLSNHTLSGGALSNHSLAAGALLPADLAAARNIQNRVHLLPPSSSFPSFSSTSSSPSSSSPLSSGSNNNNNNNDVILTGIYSLNSVPRSRPRPAAPPSQSDSELSAHTSSSLINRVLQSRNSSTSSPVHSKLVSLSQNLPSLTSASGPLVYTAVRKGTLSHGEGGISVGAGVVPHSWTRQYGTAQTRPWSSSSQSQAQPQPRPHSNPQPQPPAPQKTRASPAVQNSGTSSEQTPRIQQVFTLSEKGEGDRLRPAPASAQRSQETRRPLPHPLDTCQNFSIAMETGDEEDEWQREEELANMAAQTHIHKEQTSSSPVGAEVCVVRGSHTPPMTSSRPALLHGNTTLQGSYSLTAQTSLTGESSSQTSVGVSAAPWVISNSRKRTLQDRTQFSDGDLIQLKRYWDRGMTSLGSVCREKITAAANQLNVDTEIVKTWISNRRRKYRLMGIEIPPPKGGPAVFSTSSPGNESPVALSPDGEPLRTPELGDDLNDGGSVCLSEDGTIDSQHRDEEDGTDVSTAAPLANNVKIEVIDEDEEIDDDDDEDGELVASDLEQMQNLLEFKHEEVQFLENELENQKQKYQELVSFTKSLLSAVRDNDLERQQELMASLPQPSDQDWDMTVDRGVQSAAESADASPIHDYPQTAGARGIDPPPAQANEDVPLVTINEDDTITEVTEPSASEEQLLEAATEQE
ncbi:highly divergent homeobox isoform X1 [Stegastes partitus]|uniref:Highly divergent homeobox n=1 Tax=Stegastes partitus TaxID=144197 RepID=A0A3B4ZWP7_9TELE|nr:PREDICTED: highly divergent homeobox isoform X1 [Stegastes partitus]XP_008283181.1 PREDICTED: highly divergent homeobox isoform X1 [Stegastes partitus]